jgi:hypothetical protein
MTALPVSINIRCVEVRSTTLDIAVETHRIDCLGEYLQ